MKKVRLSILVISVILSSGSLAWAGNLYNSLKESVSIPPLGIANPWKPVTQIFNPADSLWNPPAASLNISYTDFMSQGSFEGLIYVNGAGSSPGQFYFVSLDAGRITNIATSADITSTINAGNWGGIAIQHDGYYRDALSTFNTMGLDNFKAAFSALSAAVGEDTAILAFDKNPTGFINTMQTINNMGTTEFNRVVSLLTPVALSQAFYADPYSFSNMLSAINNMGPAKFDRVVELLTPHAISQAMNADLSGTTYFLNTIQRMEGDSFDTGFAALAAAAGNDAVVQAFETGPRGFTETLTAINEMGVSDFNAAVTILTPEAVAQVFADHPSSFSEIIENIDSMGIDKFRTVCSLLTTEAVIATFKSDPSGFAQVLDTIGRMGGNFDTAYATLTGTLGSDAVVQAFKADPKGFANALRSLQSMGDSFNPAYQKLTGEVGYDAVAAAFQADPGDFINLLGAIARMGTGFDTAYAALTGVVGEDAAIQALQSDPGGFTGTIMAVDDIGAASLADIAAILGRDNLAAAFRTDASGFCLALRTLHGLGADLTPAYNALVGAVGRDTVTQTLGIDPSSFANALKAINSIGITEFNAVANALTRDVLRQTFQSNPLGFTASLETIDRMNGNFVPTYNALVAAVGSDAAIRAFKFDPKGFTITLNYINVITIDRFNAIMNPLKAEFGQQALADVLVTNGSLMHLERLYTSQWGEILGNRLENTPDDRPLAIVIYPTFDYSGVYAAEQNTIFQSLIDHGYRVMYYEVSTEGQMVDALRDASGQQQADFILFGGHGRETQLVFGDPFYHLTTGTLGTIEDVPEQYILDLSDQRQLLSASISNALVDGGTILLLSCSTGRGGDDQPNLARMMSAIYVDAEFVLAPTAPTNIAGLVYDLDTDKVINVQFTDGAGSFNAADYPLPTPPPPPGSSNFFNNFLRNRMLYY